MFTGFLVKTHNLYSLFLVQIPRIIHTHFELKLPKKLFLVNESIIHCKKAKSNERMVIKKDWDVMA